MEHLVAAAAVMVGNVEDRADWTRQMFDTITNLQKISSAFTDHETRKTECLAAEADGTRRRFKARLVGVKKINKGNNVIKGYLQLEAREDANNVDEDGYEHIETAPFYTPEGKFEYYRATTLVGQEVIIYKRLVPLEAGKKARECAAIDPA
jgi:hypothetical protein